MRTLLWGNSFVRAYKRVVKRNPRERDAIHQTLRLLAEDPYSPRLATHKLKGPLSGSLACSVGYDLRIIFEFVREEGDGEAILLTEIGTHDEVY